MDCIDQTHVTTAIWVGGNLNDENKVVGSLFGTECPSNYSVTIFRQLLRRYIVNIFGQLLRQHPRVAALDQR